MNITYNSVTIPFYDFDLPQQIVLSLSGGLDSAALMYLTCTHFPQIEIIPVTLRDISGGTDHTAAANITTWMQTEFPSVTIRNLQTGEFNDKDESIVTNAESDQFISQYPDHYNIADRDSASKSIQIDRIMQGVSNVYLRVNGVTSNPPLGVMQASVHAGFYDLSPKAREDELVHITTYTHADGNTLYQPFCNIDKGFIADIYTQNNLMETLFPLTRSCVGTAEQTSNFTTECCSCFWCYEKNWAFNLPVISV
jgi:7-cyano-7-deazaguanine synthase in queuosine biosynthesis|tara:strand:- start:233 stop:991 length:759 start_codon:yes stop_codon:yes gene_type:complete